MTRAACQAPAADSQPVCGCGGARLPVSRLHVKPLCLDPPITPSPISADLGGNWGHVSPQEAGGEATAHTRRRFLPCWPCRPRHRAGGRAGGGRGHLCLRGSIWGSGLHLLRSLFFYESESLLRTLVPVNFLGRAWRDRAKPKPPERLITRG